MQHQVYDQITFGIPGPTGDISPELQEASNAAVAAAQQAAHDRDTAQAAQNAAQNAAQSAAQSAAEAASTVAAPNMTASEAQAGVLTEARTVSPKIMGDEIDRRAAEAASAVVAPGMTAGEAQAGVVTAARTVSPKIMGDEIDRRAAEAVATSSRGVPLAALLHASASTKLSPCRVVVLGSSTAAGTGPSPQLGIVDRLAFAAGADTVESLEGLTSSTTSGNMRWFNGAVGGTTSANYAPAARISKVKLANPHYVIHMVGANDWSTGVSVSSYRANISSVLDQIETQNPSAVNILVHQQPRFDKTQSIAWSTYAEQLKSLADAKPDRRVFLDASSVFPSTNSRAYYTDKVHLNDAGTRQLFEFLAEKLGIPGTDSTGTTVTPLTFPSSKTYTGSVNVTLGSVPAASYARSIQVLGSVFAYASYAWADLGIHVGDSRVFTVRLTPANNTAPQMHAVAATLLLPPGTANHDVKLKCAISGSGEIYVSGAADFSKLAVISCPA